MSLLTVLLIGLLVWFLVLAGITVAFVRASRGGKRRVGDRRRGGDRRMGLPDPRAVPTERRRAPERRRVAV